MWNFFYVVIYCYCLEFVKSSEKTVDELQREVAQTFKTYNKYIENIENKNTEQDKIIRELKEQLRNETAMRQ